jgi:DNA-binding beta-propeller fold protein YncE
MKICGGVLGLAVSGCDALGESGQRPAQNPLPASTVPTGLPEVDSGGSPGVGSGGSGGTPGTVVVPAGLPQAIPFDSRALVKAPRKLPPISGGTLLAASAGDLAVAADPDRDRISIANLQSMALEGAIELEQGAQPGRLIEDGRRHVHVILRGTGEVASIDLATRKLVERRPVCATPRGIAFDPKTDGLLVACAEGKLVELPASSRGVTRTTAIDIDARDVVLTGNRLRVTRFRSAELLELNAQRATTERRTLPSATEILRRELTSSAFVPNVAWRAVPGPSGSTVVVHQRALADEIDLPLLEALSGSTTHGSLPLKKGDSERVGSAQSAIVIPNSGGRGAYGGGGDGCGGIVHSAISVIDADGATITSAQLAGIVLPVDVAVSPLGTVFVAAAGVIDPELSNGAPAFAFGAYTLDDFRRATVAADGGSIEPCIQPTRGEFGAAAIAVAYESVRGAFLVQTREPAEILVIDPFSTSVSRRVSLGGESVSDTGHDLFHRDAGAGVACASCHPEGTEDGHTWRFSDSGPRRTQPLDVGLTGTAPFHWDGTLPNIGALMDEVFTRRMGGLREAPERARALEEFIGTFEPRAPIRAGTDDAALRGKALFESALVGCGTCHSGRQFSNNETVGIGKGALRTQVPSLLGVAYRAPFMHDGCAATLRGRFEPDCGGQEHGNVADLDDAALDDLIAYLEAL